MARDRWKEPAHEVLRVPEGFRLETLDPTSTPGWKGGAKAVSYTHLTLPTNREV